MEKGKNNRKYVNAGLVAGGFIIFFSFLYIGFNIWDDYKDQMIQRQKEQMLLTAKSIGEGMEANLPSYIYDLDHLCETQNEDFSSESAWENVAVYVKVHELFVYDIILEDKNLAFVRSTLGQGIKEVLSDSQIDEKTNFQLVALDNEEKYLAIKRRLAAGGYISILLDGKKYYQSIMANVPMGTNGYAVIKDSEGVILMYPTDDQLGLNVIEGRMELYPSADYSSLEKMIEKQREGKQGISEYYSYWWQKMDGPEGTDGARVKKISAYVPAVIGDTFLIVSTVIDYDDFYVPIAEGYMKLVILFATATVLLILVLVYIGRLLIQRQRDTEKIEYLIGLTDVLEKMRKSEENIAHSQRLQIMGTMTGGIAHEFNNLLTPILGYADLLLLEMEGRADEQEQVKEIQDAALKAKEIIHQLSSMSRKNMETVFRKLSVQEVMERSLKMVQSICADNIQLVAEKVVENAYILGNRTQISQVLLNIVLNGIQAIGQNPGTIWIRSSLAKRTDFESDVWTEYLKIEIQDTGSGMSEEVIKQIFTPFFTTKHAGEGTGLGLALADQIIRSHKGRIFVSSEEGVGSTFTIFLPLVSAAYIQEAQDGRSGNEESIVIVDDNPKVLSMLEKNLTKIGITIFTTRTYTEAEKLLNEKTGIIILDQSIGGENGITFAMSLKGKYPELIKLIAVDVVDREVLEAKNQGLIDDYLEKPLSDVAILEKARSILNKY